MGLRPELEGLRIELNFVNGNGIYLVLDGQFRLIADDTTYNGLFRDWNGILKLTFLQAEIDIGPPIRNHGYPVCHWGPHFYLDISGPEVRHIADPTTMERFHFKLDVPQPASDPALLPQGPKVSWVPKFDGHRLQAAGRPELYLMDKGRKRHIQSLGDYHGLFGQNDRAQLVDTLSDVADGPPLVASRARLIKGNQSDTIYLFDDGRKRRIADQMTMRYYGFANGTVNVVDQGYVFEMPDGDPIAWPAANIARESSRALGA